MSPRGKRIIVRCEGRKREAKLHPPSARVLRQLLLRKPVPLGQIEAKTVLAARQAVFRLRRDLAAAFGEVAYSWVICRKGAYRWAEHAPAVSVEGEG